MSPAAVTSAPQPASRRASAATRASGRRRAIAAPLPRRISGPLRGRARVHAARQPNVTLGERALAVARSLPNHSLIDRMVRGRAWIPVLGVLLVGLIAMQVEILKLGTSTGRSIERSTALQSRYESLQAGVATLADDQRIERLAASMGMTMPSPSSEVFVSPNRQDAVGRALANIHAPDPTNFDAQLAAQIAAAAMIAPPATGASPATGAPAAAGPPAATGAAAATGTAATLATGPTTTPGTAPSVGGGAGPGSTSSGASAATPQPGAVGPTTTSGTAQTAGPSGPGGTAASSPGAAPSTAASGAAALAPASAPPSGTPSGG